MYSQFEALFKPFFQLKLQMYLYSINLKEPSTITHMECGQFLQEKSEQVVLIRGSQLLQVLSQNQNSKNLEVVLEVKLFSQIRFIKKYKDLGSTKYVLLMTSDSGRLTVLEFNKDDQNIYTYKIILNEIYCKTGIRRDSEGINIATDFKGRAIFMSALEKNKILFLTKRKNLDGQFEVSSPLEANINHQICFDLESLDVDFENPLFVAIEVNYGDEMQPQSTVFTGEKKYFLMYYEVDLSLNSIIKKKQIYLEKQYDKILPLKKRNQLSNLFLLVSDQSIKLYSELGQAKDEIDIPQREESQYMNLEKPILINFEYFQNKGYEFYLCQNSYGDIFKLTLDQNNKIEIKYLFTYKISTSFKILKSGMILFANQNSDHELYSIGNLDSKFKIKNNFYQAKSIQEFIDLNKVQTIENMGGLVEMKYSDLIGDNVGQFYCINAGVNGGSLQVVKQGNKFDVLAQTKLPVKAEQLWSLGAIGNNITDLTQYVILSHQDKLYTLQIDEKISECKQNLGIIDNVKTLDIFTIIHSNQIKAYCQVTERKLRIIQNSDDYQDYDFAEGVPILLSRKMNQKLILVTQNNDILYLVQNQLSYKELNRIRTESQPVTIEIYEPNLQRTSSNYLIVGFSDNSLIVYSLDSQNDKANSLMQISVQVLNTTPKQICILDEQIYVTLQNGYLQQTYIDPTTGMLQNGITSQIQEDQELKLFKIKNQGIKGAIIQSLSAIILEKEKNIYYYKHLILDNNDTILCLDNLNTNMGKNCFIYMTENQYLKISQLSQHKNTVQKINLEINPKKLMINQEDLLLYVMMTENRKLNIENKTKSIQKLKDKYEENFDDINQDLLQLEISNSNWVSKIGVFKPKTLEQVSSIDFQQQNNQRLLSMNFCTFKEIENQIFFGVTIVEDFIYTQNKYSKAYFNLYTIDQKNNKFNFFHQTQLEFMSYSFCSFQGKLLLSQGGYLGLYQLGQKQILKKCEFKKKFNTITNIKVANDRIFITDVFDSVHMIKYNKKENSFVEISDTILSCYTTALEVIDFNTIAIADKFGNFTINRIPQHAEQEFNEDFTNYQFTWEQGYLNGAPIKMLEVIRYYYVNLITSIQTANKSFRNQDVLLYSDIDGKIGQLIPFDEHNELDFYTHLELVLKKQTELFPTGRNHKLFRSYYGSQKGMKDGELCKLYINLNRNQRKQIAEQLELEEEDIMNWLQKFNLKSL